MIYKDNPNFVANRSHLEEFEWDGTSTTVTTYTTAAIKATARPHERKYKSFVEWYHNIKKHAK